MTYPVEVPKGVDAMTGVTDVVPSRRPDPLPVDVALSKIIVAYPWIQCSPCRFVWPRDSSHDPAHNRQCPSCGSGNVGGLSTFNAEQMRSAYEWLEAKVVDVLRRERAQAQEAPGTAVTASDILARAEARREAERAEGQAARDGGSSEVDRSLQRR